MLFVFDLITLNLKFLQPIELEDLKHVMTNYNFF